MFPFKSFAEDVNGFVDGLYFGIALLWFADVEGFWFGGGGAVPYGLSEVFREGFDGGILYIVIWIYDILGM